MFTQWVRAAGIGIPVLLLVIQLVPYGHAHTNPPVRREPAWDAPVTLDLARQACFDCHSNETVWPWYSSVAPFSWLIQSDVDRGRRRLDFSEWDRPQRTTDRASQSVGSGRMPPWYYTVLHPAARLADADRQALILGLEQTLGVGPGRPAARPGG